MYPPPECPPPPCRSKSRMCPLTLEQQPLPEPAACWHVTAAFAGHKRDESVIPSTAGHWATTSSSTAEGDQGSGITSCSCS